MQNKTKGVATTLYESSSFTNVLGDVLHPGGLELTARMAKIADITEAFLVLDLACGKGTTAYFLSQQYRCYVLGIDISSRLISEARNRIEESSGMVSFIQGDVESLPFNESVFDVVLSECSFSLLPNKEAVATEIKRVLKPGGKLVITDVTLRNNSLEQVRNQVATLPCFAGAKSIEGYTEIFKKKGFINPYVEDHSEEMKRLAYRVFVAYGSLEAFVTQLSQDLFSLKESNWLNLFKQEKPGYALIAVTKPHEKIRRCKCQQE